MIPSFSLFRAPASVKTQTLPISSRTSLRVRRPRRSSRVALASSASSAAPSDDSYKALPAAARSGIGHGKLGCSNDFFYAWTEFQFERSGGEFSWANRNDHWNFDHVVPQSAAKNGLENPFVVHSWTNLRPYPSRENSSKGSRRYREDEIRHLELVRDFLAQRVYLDADSLVETRGELLVPETLLEDHRCDSKRRRRRKL